MNRSLLRLLENQTIRIEGKPSGLFSRPEPVQVTMVKPKDRYRHVRTALKVAAIGGAGYAAYKHFQNTPVGKAASAISKVGSAFVDAPGTIARGVEKAADVASEGYTKAVKPKMTLTPLNPAKKEKVIASGKDIVTRFQRTVQQSQPKPKASPTRAEKKERLMKKSPWFVKQALKLVASQRSSRNLFANLRENDYNPERMYFEAPQQYHHQSSPAYGGYSSPHYEHSAPRPKKPSALKRAAKYGAIYAGVAGTVGAVGGALTNYHNTREKVFSNFEKLSKGESIKPGGTVPNRDAAGDAKGYGRGLFAAHNVPTVHGPAGKPQTPIAPEVREKILLNRMKQQARTTSGAWKGATSALTSPLRATKNLFTQMGRVDWKKSDPSGDKK